MILTLILCLLFAYLLGSISSAILLSRLFNFPDPRTHGSKNPGATNVLRVSNKYLAGTVLLFDFFKGLIPVGVAHYFQLEVNYIGLIAISACLGHMYPIFFNFKGGKAVATTLGALLGLLPYVGIVLIVFWLAILKLSKYASLASIITAMIAPLLAYLFYTSSIYAVLMLSLLVVFKHKDNVLRLCKGQESKIT